MISGIRMTVLKCDFYQDIKNFDQDEKDILLYDFGSYDIWLNRLL